MIGKAVAVLAAGALSLCMHCHTAAEATLSLSSKAAVLYEPQSGRVLYEKNAHTPLPMASTTKLMTALLAAEHLEWDREITVSRQAVLVEGSSLGLRDGDVLTVRDLVTGLLHASGNDAANAVALTVCDSYEAFASLMNAKAVSLGMHNSGFVTPSGLDAEGHAASAYDMALLAKAVLQEPVLAEICAAQQATVCINGIQRTVQNHNRLLKLYPDSVGLKTGYTDLAGKCLVSAARRDGVLLIAVTLNGGDYWNDHIALYEHGFSVAHAEEVTAPVLPSLAVAGGTEQQASLTCDGLSWVRTAEDSREVEARLELPRFLWAPVAEGQRVGTVSYYCGDRFLGESAVRVTEAVDARPPYTYAERMISWIRVLFQALLG